MATIYRRPDTANYFLSYMDADGKRVRRSTGTSDPRVARRILAEELARVRGTMRGRAETGGAPKPADVTADLVTESEFLQVRQEAAALRQGFAQCQLEARVLRQQNREARHRQRELTRTLGYVREILIHGIAEIDKLQ
jgi:hypothetical protein